MLRGEVNVVNGFQYFGSVIMSDGRFGEELKRGFEGISIEVQD